MPFDTKMGLLVFFEVANLTKGSITIWEVTSEWFLFCMNHHMCIELAHASNYLITDSVTFRIFVTAFKQMVFLF